MDVSAISAVTSALSAAQAQQDAGVSVLKNAVDTESNVALELIQSATTPGLGEHVDTYA
ncbi:MAG TPA: YjfB family protein [Chloroflexota bacterium]|nr:YjfB family protein [Chloroflexota bacterium]